MLLNDTVKTLKIHNKYIVVTMLPGC